MALKVLIAEPGRYSSRALEIYATLGDVEWVKDEQASLQTLVAECDILVVRLAHRVTREVIAAAPKLKIIGTSTTGLDHIDLKAANERGIAVVSLKGETEFLKTIRASTEHTMAILLALLRKIPQAAKAAEAGDWQQNPFSGGELYEKTLGIIGFGRIGSILARMAKGFDANVISTDPTVSAEVMRAAGVEPVTLDELLSRSDIVSINVPLDDATKGMFGADAFARMKKGAFLVNTSRGQIVDEAALLAALESGQVAGAALDVLTNEGQMDMREHPVIRYAREHGNLLITPHIAGTTGESLERTQVFIAEKIRATVREHAFIT